MPSQSNYSTLFSSNLKEDEILTDKWDAIYGTGGKRLSVVFGLPFAYNENSDPRFRSYEKSMLSDAPIVHITPGFIKYKGIIESTVTSAINLINFDLLPVGADERRYRFQSGIRSYLDYLNSMATLLFNDMVLSIDPSNTYGSTTIEDMLIAYTHGYESKGEIDNYKKFVKKIKKSPTDELAESINTTKVEELLKERLKETQNVVNQKNNELENATKTGNTEVKKEEQKPENIEGPLTIEEENIEAKANRFGYSYFMDASSTVSEDFSNSYGESAISQEQASRAQELRNQYYEKDMKGTLGYAKDKAIDLVTNVISGNFGGITSAVVGGLKSVGGMVSLKGLYHGALAQMPEVWNNSNFSRNYRLSFKFSSPYGDPLSVFLNVYLPMLSLMCMVMPQRIGPSEYIAPFILRVDAPGNFVTDMGVFTDMSIQRGGDASTWTVGGLPTSVEISVTLKDLVPSLIMANSVSTLLQSKATAIWLKNLSGMYLDPVGKASLELNRRLMTATAQAGFKFNPKRYIKGKISDLQALGLSIANF